MKKCKSDPASADLRRRVDNRAMLPTPLLRRLPALALLLAAAPTLAQTASPTAAPAAAASSPARAASAPPAAASAGGALQRVEITGGRDSDTEARRRSTAAKIVIGREEIDKFGDATVGEVLRRLPGVTTPGAPGRGGPPRMRGLGGGFTQLLIDGQPMPRGFSLESLPPEQVERIEILRAPTAETGARAIAGTINIITREGFKARLNDLRLGLGYENGQATPGLNWTHNNSAGPLTYNVSASLFRPHRLDASSSHVSVQDLDSGALLEDRVSQTESRQRRVGGNLNGRLILRLPEAGDSLSLTPSIFHTEAQSNDLTRLQQNLSRPGVTPTFYDTATSVGESRFTNARLGAQWRQRLGDVRVEANGTGGIWRSHSDTARTEYGAGAATPLRSFSDVARTREKSLNLTLKASGVAGGGAAPGSGSAGAGRPPGEAPEHALVAGAEVEGSARDETRVSVPDLADFGDNLKASTLRLAAYAQDEWQMTPSWGLHAGLRWEGITTHGDSGQGERPTNRSSVWTPLVHALYKPDPKSQDRVRISLTRSYRNPPLGALIARPTINREYPVVPTDQANRQTYPDSAGNPDLKPELATGIDVALERYLADGGVLSVNLFHRNIDNVIRGQVELEPSVPWSSFPRWVRRQRNIGSATTSGIELEAKFRLDQLAASAPRVEMRGNLSLYTSRVQSVPGPDNRLDQQARASGNLGADYRWRGLPLTLGGNLNWVPATTTRLDVNQTTRAGTKQVWDLYSLWSFSPAVGLRLLANNVDPRDYATTGETDTVNVLAAANERTTTSNLQKSYTRWQLRLELKL